jgi:hypothetical protein
MAFVNFAGSNWPEDASQLLQVSVTDVLAFRDRICKGGAAPRRAPLGDARLTPFSFVSVKLLG